MAVERQASPSRTLAQGLDWAVCKVNCTLGPHDRPFEERHVYTSIAAVLDGTFRYRSGHGTALLYPGSFLLGNAGACFECGHEHGTGDRCVSFGFAPSFFEEIAASAGGTSKLRFQSPMLPALPAMMRSLVDIEASLIKTDAPAMEDFAIRVAERVVSIVSSFKPHQTAPSPRDQRRISDAVRFIEEHSSEPLDLARLAAVSHMSKYHFLRTFRRMIGSTPHQYLLDMRVRRSAVRIRTGAEALTRIATDAGFSDISTFHQRFRKVLGVTPRMLRAAR